MDKYFFGIYVLMIRTTVESKRARLKNKTGLSDDCSITWL